MSHKNRTREEIKNKRLAQIADYWNRKLAPLTEKFSRTRPCGGTDYCVTASGNRAKQEHKGCLK